MNQQLAHTDYGIDAPGVVRNLVVFGIGGIVLGSVLRFAFNVPQPTLANVFFYWGIFAGAGCLISAMAMYWSSTVGKFRARDKLMKSIPWRGDEHVLDVGCGRGLLLIAAAKRLTTGKAIGVDIWDAKDQSGNRPEATWANVRAEGVVDRIEIKDADARQLPFSDKTFDVVMSSLVLHNIGNPAERQQAVREIVRVLKPGGRVALLDVLHIGEYARVMRECGMRDVKFSEPMFLFFSPLSRIVGAQKPRKEIGAGVEPCPNFFILTPAPQTASPACTSRRPR